MCTTGLPQENTELKELSAFLTDALAAAQLKARTTTLGREAAQQALVAQEKQLARERREKGRAQEKFAEVSERIAVFEKSFGGLVPSLPKSHAPAQGPRGFPRASLPSDASPPDAHRGAAKGAGHKLPQLDSRSPRGVMHNAHASNGSGAETARASLQVSPFATRDPHAGHHSLELLSPREDKSARYANIATPFAGGGAIVMLGAGSGISR